MQASNMRLRSNGESFLLSLAAQAKVTSAGRERRTEAQASGRSDRRPHEGALGSKTSPAPGPYLW